MRLQEIMSTEVVTVADEAPAERARALMDQHAVHHLVVTDTHGFVCGVLSDRDLGGRQGDLPVGVRVLDRMARSVVTAAPTTTVREAANLLRGHSIGCLPVMDGRALRGIVTVSDLLTLIGHGSARPVVRNARSRLPGHSAKAAGRRARG